MIVQSLSWLNYAKKYQIVKFVVMTYFALFVIHASPTVNQFEKQLEEVVVIWEIPLNPPNNEGCVLVG